MSKIPFLILCTLLIASCCKSNKCKCNKEWGERVDDCTPVHFGPFPLGGAKDYLYFKPGSWWVYRNSLSGETDSIYTVYCDTAVEESQGDPNRWLTLTYTTIAYQLKSTVYNTTYIYERIKQHPYTSTFEYTQAQWRTMIAPKKSRGPYPVFIYPFKDAAADFIELIPILNIQGADYSEVAVFQSDNFDETVQLPTQLPYTVTYGGINKYYWAKGAGLVQIESLLYKPSDSSTVWQKWELVKSHLTPPI